LYSILNLFFGLLTDTHAHIAHMQLKHKSTVSVRPSPPLQFKKDLLPPSKKGPFLPIKDPVSQSTPCLPLLKTSILHSKKDPQSTPFQKGTTSLKKRSLQSPERNSPKRVTPLSRMTPLFEKPPLPSPKRTKGPSPLPAPTSR
jgi:hypothetical protein